ncbi:MAG: DUF1638 domain-containing protein [Anaeromyxobacteraceae bacterium]
MTTPAAPLLACRFLVDEVREAAARLGANVEVRRAPCAARCSAGGPLRREPPAQQPGEPPTLVAACADPRLLAAWPPASTTFHLLADAALLDPALAAGALLVTPGWLRTWREELAQGGPLAPALELVREAHRKVVLLDTGLDAGAPAAAAELAATLELPLERQAIPLDHLAREVALALETARRMEAEHRAADKAALLDTLYELPPTLGEPEVLGRFADLVDVLFAPERLAILVLGGPLDGEVMRRGAGDVAALEAALRGFDGELAPGPGGAGLLLRLGPADAPVARLGFEGVAFPAHLPRYRRLAPALAAASFLAISRARELGALERSEAALRAHRDRLESLVQERTATLSRTVEELAAALRKVETLHGLLPICAHCKKIKDDEGYWTKIETYISDHSRAEFSHGLCPECFDRYYPDADEGGGGGAP